MSILEGQIELAQDHLPEEDDIQPLWNSEGEITESGQSKCKRCGRWFQPRYQDQQYGPVCARKEGAHSAKLLDGTVEIYDARGVRTTVIV